MAVDVGMNDFEKFIYASMYGFDVELDGLIKKHKKDITVGAALMLAAENGHVECVELLIPISDPLAEYEDSNPLTTAAFNGHADCVKLLIPVSDPKSGNNGALQWAALNGHVECVKLLIPVSDVERFRSRFKMRYWFEPALPTLERAEEEMEVEKQRERLAEAIGMKIEQKPVKKRRM